MDRTDASDCDCSAPGARPGVGPTTTDAQSSRLAGTGPLLLQLASATLPRGEAAFPPSVCASSASSDATVRQSRSFSARSAVASSSRIRAWTASWSSRSARVWPDRSNITQRCLYARPSACPTHMQGHMRPHMQTSKEPRPGSRCRAKICFSFERHVNLETDAETKARDPATTRTKRSRASGPS